MKGFSLSKISKKVHKFIGQNAVDLLNGKAVFLLLILCSLNLSSSADEPLKSKMRHYSTEDGLSHDGVLCITRDKEGFMWFGTWDGINRFDGTNFVTYKARPGDRSTLKNNKIRNIIEDIHGFLWVKTYDNKVYRFDKGSENFLAITKTSSGAALDNINVEKMVCTSVGDTWLITEEHGLVSAVNNQSEETPYIYNYSTTQGGHFKIPSNQINFLFEDANKKVWAGSDKGLFCFVKRGNSYHQYFNFKNESHFFAEDFKFTCADGKDNLVYFGTATGEITIYDSQKRVFKTKQIAKGLKINAIKVAKSGMVYITTSGRGLMVLNPKTLVVSDVQPGIKQTFFTIYEDKLGDIWLEPEFNGVVRYHPATKTLKLFLQKKEKNIPASIAPKAVPDRNYNIFEDVNGVLWASMKGGGFGYYDKENDRISYIDNEPGSKDQQLSNEVVCAFADKTGVLWLSTRFGGIHKFVFPTNNFQHKQLVPNSLNRYENEVRAIFEDSKNRLWVATKIGQLYVYDKYKKALGDQLFTNITSKDFGSIYAIKERKDGSIWLGTKGQGLVILTPQDATRSKYTASRYLENDADKNSINSNMIYALLEDRSGAMWIGTFGGGINEAVRVGNKIQFKNGNNYYKNYPIKTCNVIRHLEEGVNGNIWIATTDGLLRFDPRLKSNSVFYRTQKIPGDAHSLGNNDVQYIYKDSQKQIWVGTFGGGLNKVKGKPALNHQVKFDVYTKEQGLPNDIVLNIVDDGAGNLWMATEYGLSKFNIKENSFRNFDSYEGLPKVGFSEAASFKTANGALCFGSINGYILFFPAAITSKKFEVNMALTNLQLFNNDVSVGAEGSPLAVSLNQAKKIELKYDQNVINIDYSILDYRTTHNLSYAYILEGYDKEWHDVKNQKRASYTRLPPGDYVFKVKSLNYDLFENIPAKSIAITILPPFWLTIWAYIVYLIIAVVLIAIARNIIITMIRLRNKVVVEHKLTDLKLQFFTNISHELRTPLTLILNPLKQVTKTEELSDKGREYLNIVYKNANRMVRFINQLLDFRKIQSGKIQLKVAEVEIVSFVKDIAAYFNEVAEEKKIKFLISADIDSFMVFIDEEKIDIVIYNLLSNAFKFTPNGKTIAIQIDCLSNPDHFFIKIIDQGTGVPKNQLAEIFELYYEGENHHQSQKGTGIGLALSKDIVATHKGQVSAQNNEIGMTFTLALNKGNAHFQAADMADKHDNNVDQQIIYPTESLQTSKNSVESEDLEDKKEKPLVLLVEDNTELRKFLADQLVDFYRVKQAADGAEGLKAAIEILPDLIISDVMMPNMDGVEMLVELKNNVQTSHIPVILLTAKSSIENQINGLKYGADFYITKPFDVEHILACMSNLIKRRENLYQSFLNERKTLKLEPSEIVITSKDEKFLKEVITIVEEAMIDPQFNIDSVAAAIGMGRTTFYKKLKCLTQRSPVEFVRDMRLKRGKQLLDAKENTISEVAYMIGFSSSGYFSTCFKEEYKISPSDYLRNIGRSEDVE